MINRHDELVKNSIKTSKGVIIAGPSGCGKTLFSDCLMNSVNLDQMVINFNSVSDSPIESIIKTFTKAKEEKNKIIFIDEIGLPFVETPFSNNDNTQLLKLLVEQIDSIEDEDNIYIVATTTKIYEINETLSRSGRLDQIINLDYPNNENRKELLKESFNGVKLDKKINYKDLVNFTVAFSVADVLRFANECKRDLLLYNKAVLDDKTSSTIANEIILKSNCICNNCADDDIVGYHEAGHAICSLAMNRCVSSISILKYNNSLGNTRMYEDVDKIKSKEDLLKNLVILYGGRVAEKIKYNTEFTGSADDIIRATALAKEMVSCLGMYGLEYVTKKESEVVSESKLKERENIMNSILSDAFDKAEKIITSNMKQLEKLHDLLIKNKTITGSMINKIKINY